MYAVATFLIVAVITTVFVQMATGALIATGLPPDIAAFQSRSAFSGAGFTTTEAENVVNHPLRRKIIATSMFVGSLGTPTLVVTVLAGLVAPGPGSTTERTLVAISGLLLLILAIGVRPMRRWLAGIGQRYARRRLIAVLDDPPRELLALSDDYVVGALTLAADPVDAIRSLRGLDGALPEVTVLGVRRGADFFGEAPIDIELNEGDELIVYTSREHLADITSRFGIGQRDAHADTPRNL